MQMERHFHWLREEPPAIKEVMNMSILRAACFSCMLCMTVLLASVATAAPQIIEAEGIYTMGDNDSPKIARDAARQEAMRSATEQAGVYVESYTETQNLTLTADEVRMVAATVLRVLKEDSTPELIGDTWRYRVHLVCEVDTARVDLAALAQNKAELARLQKERDELKRQNEELLTRYERAQGSEKAAIGAQLEESYALGRIFDEAAAMIQRGEEREAVAQLSRVINDPAVKNSPLAYAYYLRGRAYYELQSPQLALSDFSAAERTPHTSELYPIWRVHQYRGRIYYEAEQYDAAAEELRRAWDASDKDDDELWMELRRAEHRSEQEQRHRERGDGGARRGINWTQIIGEIIRGSIEGA